MNSCVHWRDKFAPLISTYLLTALGKQVLAHFLSSNPTVAFFFEKSLLLSLNLILKLYYLLTFYSHYYFYNFVNCDLVEIKTDILDKDCRERYK